MIIDDYAAIRERQKQITLGAPSALDLDAVRYWQGVLDGVWLFAREDKPKVTTPAAPLLPPDPKAIAEIARFMLATHAFLEAERVLAAFCKPAK